MKIGLVDSLTGALAALSQNEVAGAKLAVDEINAKRLGLLHDLVPKAARIAVLINPTNALTAQPTLRDVQEAAPHRRLV